MRTAERTITIGGRPLLIGRAAFDQIRAEPEISSSGRPSGTRYPLYGWIAVSWR